MKYDYKVLKDSDANQAFNTLGFSKVGRISSELVEELIRLNTKLSIPDYFNCGFNVGMNTDIKTLRKAMQDELNAHLSFVADEYLNAYEIYTASFLNKMAREDCFVIAHQDFTYTDESQYPSFMCWIPLVDTTIQNAALGFIPRSQEFFDYIRAFPFPQIPSPVTENSVELMKYFTLLEMKAGEIVFFMHNTIHGSFCNYSAAQRPAVGLSFVKKNVSPNLFIHNPKTKGHTLLKYEVDKYSLVDYNNPHLRQMYANGKIELPYTLLDEIEYPFPETSWQYVHGILEQYQLQPNSEFSALIDKYKEQVALKNKPKSTLSKIYHKLFKRDVVLQR
ncbi:MAG: phytanoyl-CoA dioxygenase family protein [Chitinophagales bacterium]